MEVLQRLSETPVAQEGAALLMWSAWAVESLGYLDDLERSYFVEGNTGGFPGEVIDLAHVRWSAGTAMTALDLCAASLGVWYCGVAAGSHQRKVKDFADPASRLALPGPAAAWIETVLADSDFGATSDTRNPFTHGRVARHISVGNVPTTAHAGRTELRQRGGSLMSARDVVVRSRELAWRHVQSFLDGVDAADFGP